MSNAKRPPTTQDSRRGRLNCPEVKLWLKVLQLAVIDAFAQPGEGVTVRGAIEAQEWLAGGGPRLAFVCEAVNIDAGMVESWAGDMAAKGWPGARMVIWKRTCATMLRTMKFWPTT